jgi:hypothetical protein
MAFMVTPGRILDGFSWDAIADETIELYRSL